MEHIILAANAVRQDLIDTGETNSVRWRKLMELETSKRVLRIDWDSETPSVLPQSIQEFIQDLELGVRPYQKILGMTMHLADRLAEATKQSAEIAKQKAKAANDAEARVELGW